MKRRVFIILLIMAFVAAGLPGVSVYAGVKDDIEIDYEIDESKINVGDIFELTFSFKDISDENITELKYEIKTSSIFEVLSGNSKESDVEFDTEYTVNLRYLGGSNLLPVKLDYKRNGSSINNTYLNIEINEIDEDSSSGSGGSSENEPKLIIESTSIPAAKAGDTMTIPLTIKNDSRYAAKNISVKLSLRDTSENPFEVDSLNLTQTISTLGSKKDDGVVFKLKVLPYAEERTYALDVNFKYSNTRGSIFSSSETIYVKVTNNKNEPMLVIQDIRYSANPVKAGAKMQVSLNVSNMGDLDAEAVKVSVEGLDKEGFTLSSGVDSWYFDKIMGNEKENILINLVADDSMESGNYGLNIKMEYKDKRNNSYSNDARFFIRVEETKHSSNIVIKNITTMPQEVKTNENFLLSFDVENEGESAIRNVKVSIKGDEGLISMSPDVRILEEMKPGQKEKLEFMLHADDEVKTKNYNILITLEYEGKGKENHTVNQYAGVYVNGESKLITPKIIINNYNFEPKVVRAGEEFDLDLTFMNTSSSREVKNIKIFLTGIDSDEKGDVVFTPVGSSNTFYIDTIKPKGTVQRSIVMYTIPDAQPKYYNITANIEYQDEEGTEYKASELIGIPVIQQSKLDASQIELPSEVFIGEPVPLSLQYYNKGKTKLTNLMIKVEGDFFIENGEAFIGNFESGYSDYFEAMITAQKPGTTEGKVVFTFEDPSGQELTYEREFSINAIEMPPMEMPGEMMPEPESLKDKVMNNTIKNKFFWAGVAVFAAAVVTAVKLIRKKRRKGLELDE